LKRLGSNVKMVNIMCVRVYKLSVLRLFSLCGRAKKKSTLLDMC
jgi:hypothetical protein